MNVHKKNVKVAIQYSASQGMQLGGSQSVSGHLFPQFSGFWEGLFVECGGSE